MRIILYGPDGAGKTSIAQILKAVFKKRGRKVAYIRLRAHHYLAYIILEFLKFLHIVPRTTSPRLLDYSLRRIFRKSRMFLFIEAINSIMYIITKVQLAEALGYVIVTERFIPDFLVTLMIETENREKIMNMLLSKALLGYLCSNSNRTFIVYITASEEALLLRKKDENLSFNYIRYQLALYNFITKYLAGFCNNRVSIISVDTTQTRAQEVVNYIVKIVGLNNVEI